MCQPARPRSRSVGVKRLLAVAGAHTRARVMEIEPLAADAQMPTAELRVAAPQALSDAPAGSLTHSFFDGALTDAIAEGDLVIVFETKDLQRHIYVQPGSVYQNYRGAFAHARMVGMKWGSKVSVPLVVLRH
jgi:hypothetical protein